MKKMQFLKIYKNYKFQELFNLHNLKIFINKTRTIFYPNGKLLRIR